MSIYGKQLGIKGEDIATDYLIKNGYLLIERNFRSKFGEIDIITRKNRRLYFVEVKTRTSLEKGKPYEAVTTHKKQQMYKAATYYLLVHPHKDFTYSLSVMSILMNENGSFDLKFFENI